MTEEERTNALTVRVTPGVERRTHLDAAFFDYTGSIVARVTGTPLPLNWSQGASILEIIRTLSILSEETRQATRPVTAFSYATIEPLERGMVVGSKGAPTEDPWDLRAQLVQQLNAEGRWTLVDSLAAVPQDARTRWLSCRPLIVPSVPTFFKLACADEKDVPVISVTGGNCRGCWGGQWSPEGDAARAVRDLMRSLADHRRTVERVYAVQIAAKGSSGSRDCGSACDHARVRRY